MVPLRLVLFRLALVVAATSAAFGKEPAESAEVQAMHKNGVLQGCSVFFRAAHKSRDAGVVILNGRIGVSRNDGGLLTFLKLGLTDAGARRGMKRPRFAYLQTKSATTANSTPLSSDTEDGARMFGGPFDDPSRKLVNEMLEAGRVEIRFNRAADESDVIVPLNLRASDAQTPRKFGLCLQQLLAADDR